MPGGTEMLTRRKFVALAAAAPMSARFGLLPDDSTLEPHCFLTPARLQQARRLKNGPLAEAWRRMQEHCEDIVHAGLVKYSSPTPLDVEMLWERVVANGLPTLAMGYFLSGNGAYKEFAFEQAREACGYPLWGGQHGSTGPGLDLAAGHLLFGLGLTLDWLGSEMDEATRSLVLDTLKRQGALMADGSGTVYWARTLLQNHLWVNMTGLLTAALALRRYDTNAARPLMATAVQRMTPCFDVLAADGSDQEGPGYWSYGAEYLLKFHHLATELLGLKVETPWLHTTQDYCIAMTLPLACVSPKQSIFDQADSPRTPWYGPEYLLRRLAALNRSTIAQEMGDRLERLAAVESNADWLNFVWYDPSVPASGLQKMPTQQFFPDLDLVVARSDRSGHESAVVMRSGPPLGNQVQAKQIPYNLGTSHTHPDVNHITLFGAGEFLLLDDGYASVKETHQHNTLLINNKGQTGSGGQWTVWPTFPLPNPQPAMKAVTSQPAYDYWVGEGAAAYPSNSGLSRFDRHVLFVKPDVLVVIDDLEADEDAEFKLLWHPGAKPEPGRDGAYTASVAGATLKMQFVLSSEAQVALGERPYPVHPDPGNASGHRILQEISVTLKGKAANPAAVFAWASAGSAVRAATAAKEGGVWMIRADNAGFSVDMRKRRVQLV